MNQSTKAAKMISTSADISTGSDCHTVHSDVQLVPSAALPIAPILDSAVDQPIQRLPKILSKNQVGKETIYCRWTLRTIWRIFTDFWREQKTVRMFYCWNINDFKERETFTTTNTDRAVTGFALAKDCSNIITKKYNFTQISVSSNVSNARRN